MAASPNGLMAKFTSMVVRLASTADSDEINPTLRIGADAARVRPWPPSDNVTPARPDHSRRAISAADSRLVAIIDSAAPAMPSPVQLPRPQPAVPSTSSADSGICSTDPRSMYLPGVGASPVPRRIDDTANIAHGATAPANRTVA